MKRFSPFFFSRVRVSASMPVLFFFSLNLKKKKITHIKVMRLFMPLTVYIYLLFPLVLFHSLVKTGNTEEKHTCV